MHAQTMTPSSIMDGSKMASLQILTLILCFLIVAADGFDVASVGYVAPLLKKEWSLSPAQLGARRSRSPRPMPSPTPFIRHARPGDG